MGKKVEVQVPEGQRCANAKKKCGQSHGLAKAKNGKYYCAVHNPDHAAKIKIQVKKAGEKSGEARRLNKAVLDLNIEPNKASILKAFIELGNFMGNGLKKGETRKMGLLVNVLDRIHEYATNAGDDSEKEEKVSMIMESKLPDSIKLSKLVDIVGPERALKLVPVTLERDPIEDPKTLDGLELLREKGDGGKPTISAPEAFSIVESDDTSDVPAVDLDAPTLAEVNAKDAKEIEANLPAAPAAPPAPPPALAPVVDPAGKTPEMVAEETRRLEMSGKAKELLGLYKAKVKGNFLPHQQVGQIFMGALLEGVPFDELRLRVLTPKSDTDQPQMMVNDVKAAIVKRTKTA